MTKKLSFIMPAYNEEKYIGEAIKALQQLSFFNWELIIVDDNSIDGTKEVVFQYCKKDDRIKYFKNKGNGKVIGLSYGYEQTTGDVIKCIDADDIIMPEFDQFIGKILATECVCHGYVITDEDLNHIGRYVINPRFISSSFSDCINNMISLPRCTWSFARKLADKLFPIPSELPFEDVWFSLVLKKYATNIHAINKPLYKYRQHANQTYQGILNFSKNSTIFRANRMLRVIEVLSKLKDFHEEMFNPGYISTYYRTMAKEKISLTYIIKTGLNYIDVIRLILYKKLYFVLPIVLRLKWLYDKYK